MGRSNYARCQVCGKSRHDGEEISWTGLCGECGATRLASNVWQMHRRSGPNFDKWRRNMAAAVGGVLLDDAPNRGKTP